MNMVAPSVCRRVSRIALLVVPLLLSVLAPTPVRANVYATAIKLNSGFTNAIAGAGTNVVISYILNEDATAGVTVEIKSGATTVRTYSFAAGAAGSLKGTNSLTWDALDNSGQLVYSGLYSVAVTALARGFSDWTQTSSDANDGNQIWEGRGIAINRNSNSIYYGRVFVGNAADGPNADIDPLDRIGIHKMNADGSFADEGGSSDGGYNWSHDQFNDDYSPWKLEIGSDDRIYVNDHHPVADPGVVLSFDQLISSNSLQVVLDASNCTNFNSSLSGMAITGAGTNLELWMADANGGLGVARWDATNSGRVATNDQGAVIVQAGLSSDLDQAPEDVAVDSSNRIYVIQRRQLSGDPSVRVLRFPAYGGTPETLADWKIGSGDDTMGGAYGVAVDPTGTYVAVAFRGTSSGFDFINGAARVFATSNGTPVATLTPQVAPSHAHYDVAWDNVGNLYTIDDYDGIWRVYSPPGTNQATTVAVPQIQVNGLTPMPPLLSVPSYDGSTVTFTLFGQPNQTYTIQSSPDLMNWNSVATNTAATSNRVISVSSTAIRQFYRAKIGQ